MTNPTHSEGSGASPGPKPSLDHLRGQIDSELFRRHDKMEGPILKAAFEELTRLYHAEHVHGMPVRPPEVTE